MSNQDRVNAAIKILFIDDWQLESNDTDNTGIATDIRCTFASLMEDYLGILPEPYNQVDPHEFADRIHDIIKENV